MIFEPQQEEILNDHNLSFVRVLLRLTNISLQAFLFIVTTIRFLLSQWFHVVVFNVAKLSFQYHY